LKNIEESYDSKYEHTKKTTKENQKNVRHKESPDEREEKIKNEIARQACKRMQ
jgi:hypothetical protein